MAKARFQQDLCTSQRLAARGASRPRGKGELNECWEVLWADRANGGAASSWGLQADRGMTHALLTPWLLPGRGCQEIPFSQCFQTQAAGPAAAQPCPVPVVSAWSSWWKPYGLQYPMSHLLSSSSLHFPKEIHCDFMLLVATLLPFLPVPCDCSLPSQETLG